MHIFERFQTYLKIPSIYLYDDAKFTYKSPKNPKQKVELQALYYLPLVDPLSRSFYTSWAGFDIASCKNLPHAREPKFKFNQDKEKFDQAVSLIKHTKIYDEFRDIILKKYSNFQAKLEALLKKVNRKIALTQESTVGELFTKLNSALREEKDPQERYQIAQLMDESIHFFIRYNPGKSVRQHSFIREYNHALLQMSKTRILLRESIV